MMHRHRHKTAILTRPGAKRDPHIFKIPDAIEALNSGLGIGECWNLNQNQHPNDGNASIASEILKMWGSRFAPGRVGMAV